MGQSGPATILISRAPAYCLQWLLDMSSQTMSRKRRTKGGLIFALWTFIGLASSTQTYLSFANSSSPVTWKFALEHSMADWYLYALLSVPALALARRFHFERGRWPRQLAVHGVASIV